jgi:hypothetical protein
MGYKEDVQALRLMKAFASIKDPEVRRRIVDQVEAMISQPPAGPEKPDTQRPAR